MHTQLAEQLAEVQGDPRAVPASPGRHRCAAPIAAGPMLRIAGSAGPPDSPMGDVRPNPAPWIGRRAILAIAALQQQRLLL